SVKQHPTLCHEIVNIQKRFALFVQISAMNVLKNVKNIPTWNTADCVLRHVEDVLKNVIK
ncbi:MAG TPA: hypothetical protein VI278_00845, partial [Nitrososphaeraceae archaeon]